MKCTDVPELRQYIYLLERKVCTLHVRTHILYKIFADDDQKNKTKKKSTQIWTLKIAEILLIPRKTCDLNSFHIYLKRFWLFRLPRSLHVSLSLCNWKTACVSLNHLKLQTANASLGSNGWASVISLRFSSVFAFIRCSVFVIKISIFFYLGYLGVFIFVCWIVGRYNRKSSEKSLMLLCMNTLCVLVQECRGRVFVVSNYRNIVTYRRLKSEEIKIN